MDTIITEAVKKFAEQECREKNSEYYAEWMHHLESVSSTSVKLAEKLNADPEIVFLASWLHDIGTIMYGKKDHHITGAKIAEEKLTELGYPEEKINQVKHCIMSHRASQNIPRETTEAQIVADADAMAHFDSIEDLFKAYFVFGHLDREQAKQHLQQKLMRSWNKLSPEGKKFAETKYSKILNNLR